MFLDDIDNHSDVYIPFHACFVYMRRVLAVLALLKVQSGAADPVPQPATPPEMSVPAPATPTLFVPSDAGLAVPKTPPSTPPMDESAPAKDDAGGAVLAEGVPAEADAGDGESSSSDVSGATIPGGDAMSDVGQDVGP